MMIQPRICIDELIGSHGAAYQVIFDDCPDNQGHTTINDRPIKWNGVTVVSVPWTIDPQQLKNPQSLDQSRVWEEVRRLFQLAKKKAEIARSLPTTRRGKRRNRHLKKLLRVTKNPQLIAIDRVKELCSKLKNETMDGGT